MMAMTNANTSKNLLISETSDFLNYLFKLVKTFALSYSKLK